MNPSEALLAMKDGAAPKYYLLVGPTGSGKSSIARAAERLGLAEARMLTPADKGWLYSQPAPVRNVVLDHQNDCDTWPASEHVVRVVLPLVKDYGPDLYFRSTDNFDRVHERLTVFEEFD